MWKGQHAAHEMPESVARHDGSAVLRVLTYNVRSMRDDRDALARVIRACAPDVVCLQEVPRFLGWKRRLRRLAERCGLSYIGGGRPAAGQALLAGPGVTVLRTEDVLLPRRRRKHQRGFAIVHLMMGSAKFAVLSVHLSLADGERRAQADMLLGRMAGFENRCAVAAGDFNEPAGRAVWRRLAVELRDARSVAPWGEALTFEAANPQRRIDGVFVTPGVAVLGCGVPVGLNGITDALLSAASDHRPVLAALHIPAES